MERKNLLVMTLVGLLIGGMVNAQQLQYITNYEDNQPWDSVHVYYGSSTATESDSVRHYSLSSTAGSYLRQTIIFYYDAQSNCIKREYYDNSGRYFGKDSIFYGTDGIDSVVSYDNNGSVASVRQFIYNNSKLVEMRRITYNNNGTIDTMRNLLVYDPATGFIKMDVFCNNMSNTSCADTSWFYVGSDGKLDSFVRSNPQSPIQEFGIRYVVTKYESNYDIFSNNVLVRKQIECYVDPYYMATTYMMFKDVKAASGVIFDPANPSLADPFTIEYFVLKTTNTERLEQLLFQTNIGTSEERYYYTGSQLPLSVPVAQVSTWEVNSYFVDDYLHIESQESLKDVRIFTVGGKILLDKRLDGESRVVFNMSALPKGMYYMRVVSVSGEVKFLPIVK